MKKPGSLITNAHADQKAAQKPADALNSKPTEKSESSQTKNEEKKLAKLELEVEPKRDRLLDFERNMFKDSDRLKGFDVKEEKATPKEKQKPAKENLHEEIKGGKNKMTPNSNSKKGTLPPEIEEADDDNDIFLKECNGMDISVDSTIEEQFDYAEEIEKSLI